MTHISAEVAGWAAVILAQGYIDKIGAALCITMAVVLCIGCTVANLIT